MIKQVHLTNWKSFGSAVLHVDPLTMLIGLNASGKSNVVDALSLLQRLTQLNIYEALAGDKYVPELRGGIENAVLEGETELSLEVLIGTDNPDLSYRYKISLRTKFRFPVTREELLMQEELSQIDRRYGEKRTKNGKNNKSELMLFQTKNYNGFKIDVKLHNEKIGKYFLASRTKTVLSQLVSLNFHPEVAAGVMAVYQALSRIFILDIIPQKARTYVRIDTRLASDGSNIAGVLAAMPAEEKQKIEARISAFASRLPEQEISHIHATTVPPLNTDAMLLCEEKIGTRTRQVDARSLSDGTLRFLALMVAALTCPAGSLLVVEEIDNGIHPSRAKLLLEMLQEVGEERGVDMLATTHNVALLNQLTPDWYPFVTVAHRVQPSGNSTLTLLEDVADLPRLMGLGPLGTVAANGSLEQALNHQPHEA